MGSGTIRMEQGDQILPFVWCFYGSPSCLWEDETGNVQDIPQGEGGSKVTLMPLLFALGLHRAHSVRERMQDKEKVFAFLDDV